MNTLLNTLNFDDHMPHAAEVTGWHGYRYVAELVPVFVYGTLRPSRRNGTEHGYMFGARPENGGPWWAYMPGRLYYHRCGAYPVMDVDADHGNLITGNLYLVDVNSPDWKWVDDMEVGAGYEPTWRTAYLAQDGAVRRTEALVYHWPHDDYRGDELTTGDWYDAEPRPWPTTGGE